MAAGIIKDGRTMGTSRPRVVVTAYLREEQAKALQQLSIRDDVPQSVLLRTAVDRLLRESGMLKD
jgi:hypothetical protein